MKKILGVEKNYPWGTNDVIPTILGRQPEETPVAECWFGTHPSGDSLTETGEPLSQYIAKSHQHTSAASSHEPSNTLPYLVKLLSAQSPLSLQAHPTRPHAEHGYARESRLEIPLDSPKRSFKDRSAKPEIIIALTQFHGLAGFRDPVTTANLFESLGAGSELLNLISPLHLPETSTALEAVFLATLALPRGSHLLEQFLTKAAEYRSEKSSRGHFARTAIQLHNHFPGDPSILAALMLNRFSLNPGEALSIDAGVIHAYLHGSGVEVMGNSDNVLRGGLTEKHIDIESLRTVVSFSPTQNQTLPTPTRAPLTRYPSRIQDFEVWALRPDDTERFTLPRTDSGRILLTLEGSFDLISSAGELTLNKGEAAYLSPRERTGVRGLGVAFLVGPGAPGRD